MSLTNPRTEIWRATVTNLTYQVDVRSLLESSRFHRRRRQRLYEMWRSLSHHDPFPWQLGRGTAARSSSEPAEPCWHSSLRVNVAPGDGRKLRRQIATHKRFKRLIDQWLDLSIEHSQLTMQTTKTKSG